MARALLFALLAVALVACASTASRTTQPAEDGSAPTDGRRGEPANAGPFQAEEAAEKGPPHVVITNGTEEAVNVEFAGPGASRMTIAPGDTQAFTSVAGVYAVTLSDPAGAHEATTLAGLEIENDYVYTWIIRLKAPE